MPGIEGRIRREIERTKAEVIHDLFIKGFKISGVRFIERLGMLGQDDIAILRVSGRHNPAAIAPQIFLLNAGRIGLILIAAAFDPQTAVRVPAGLVGRVKAVGQVFTRVILLDPGINMFNIRHNGLT